jgi:pyruvate dehydrogenase E1 component beta subunit
VTDARIMLLAALAEPDPVLIFEHAMLYPLDGELDEDADPASVWQACVRRPGRDVSLITYGGSLGKCLSAAEELTAEGINAEVVDLRVLRPLDLDTVISSVSRTHRAVIVDEGWKTCGLAAELIASIVERGFYELDAPVERVCSEEVPIPYPKHLEDAALPNAERIKTAVRKLFAKSA